MMADVMGHSPAGSSYVTDFDHGSNSHSTRVTTYGKLPLAFEVNRGQTDSRVRFCARGSGYGLFFTATQAILYLRRPGCVDGKQDATGELSANEVKDAVPTGAVVTIGLMGANPAAQLSGRMELPGTSNYFLGNDPSQWITDVPTYDAVCYTDVYPGVDVVYYGSQHQLEYDFVLAPGVDPHAITLGFGGASNLTITSTGDLLIQTPAGEVLQRRPFVYQEYPTGKHEVHGHYVCAGGQRVGFEVGSYDPSRPLIIDPVLTYSTYLGGTGFDVGYGIAVDEDGNAYITGRTQSANFPTTTGVFQPADPDPNPINSDVFVTKLNRQGSALIYSTYLGGSGDDGGNAIAVDESGNVYITGRTNSANFPITAGAFQPAKAGPAVLSDVFVTKLNRRGSALVYSTYLGGTEYDVGWKIAVDEDGNAYVTGRTQSANFPITAGAFQPVKAGPAGENDAFVTKLNRRGSALVYSTYLGGTEYDFGRGIAVDEDGNAYITGETLSVNFPTTTGAFQAVDPDPNPFRFDAFVTKLNQTGSALVYSTYLGGIGDDHGNAIAVEDDGNAYITGRTTSANFPTTAGVFQPVDPDTGNYDAFVTKLNRRGSALVYSTYVGGTSDDRGHAIAVDDDGKAYITGQTNSANFPTTAGAFQSVKAAPANEFDAFVTKLNRRGSALVYSTYLGGTQYDSGEAIAVDEDHDFYVTGRTLSVNFPTTAGAFQTADPDTGDYDAFVTRFSHDDDDDNDDDDD
jgi:Beta-propeller repeat